MNKTDKEILTFLSKQDKNTYLKRVDIEAKLPYIGKRALLGRLKNLEQDKRIAVFGSSTATSYRISSAYAQFEEMLYIYQNQVLVGYLGFVDGEYRFAYDTDYLLDPGSGELRFEMPISTKTFFSKRCFLDFEETLPEGIDRKILAQQTGNDTEFFLLANNNYSQNDLIFSPEVLTFEKPVEKYAYLPNKKAILGKDKFPNILNVKVALHEEELFPTEDLEDKKVDEVRTISLSGYQHKLQVVLEEGVIRKPGEQDDIVYFIKPYSRNKADPNSRYYFPHMAINEHLHLSFAKNALKFDVPESAIFKRPKDSEYHYMVKYFDRHKGFKFQRKEMSTFMGLNSDRKYDTTSERVFDKVAKILPREEDRLHALMYYFYSFLIKHEDMHTKNLSVLIDKKKTLISPLYDIATTGIYSGVYGYESHLPIAGKRSNIKPADFHVLCERADVSKNKFNEGAKQVIETYIQEMPKYINKVGKCNNPVFFHKGKKHAFTNERSIVGKDDLEVVLRKNYIERLEALGRQGWTSSLKIDPEMIESAKERALQKNGQRKMISGDVVKEVQDEAKIPTIRTYLS